MSAMFKFYRDERGSAIILEYTVVLALCFLITGALILLGLILFEQAALEIKTVRVAQDIEGSIDVESMELEDMRAKAMDLIHSSAEVTITEESNEIQIELTQSIYNITLRSCARVSLFSPAKRMQQADAALFILRRISSKY